MDRIEMKKRILHPTVNGVRTQRRVGSGKNQRTISAGFSRGEPRPLAPKTKRRRVNGTRTGIDIHVPYAERRGDRDVYVSYRRTRDTRHPRGTRPRCTVGEWGGRKKNRQPGGRHATRVVSVDLTGEHRTSAGSRSSARSQSDRDRKRSDIVKIRETSGRSVHARRRDYALKTIAIRTYFRKAIGGPE